uniref:FkbM family methyltransferase n=1 Tax=Algoriphagus sp. TaxID=1872435 RepID=UPI00404887DD
MLFRKTIKNTLRKLGYDISKISVTSNSSLQLVKGFDFFDIDLVLDVGANVGQFANELRDFGYSHEIVSFEPLSSAHAKISNACKNDPKWRVHKRCAVGDIDGETLINISNNSVSSSVLPMTELHTNASVGSSYIGAETVELSRLDTVGQEYIFKAKNTFLKIDTQGFEWQVIEGAQGVLPQIKGILCEMSILPLYEGQYLWLEIINKFEGMGYTLWSIQKGFSDERDGRSLQVDLVFYRL